MPRKIEREKRFELVCKGKVERTAELLTQDPLLFQDLYKHKFERRKNLKLWKILSLFIDEKQPFVENTSEKIYKTIQ